MLARYRVTPKTYSQITGILKYADHNGGLHDWNGPSGNMYGGNAAIMEYPKEISYIKDVVGNPKGYNPVEQYTLKSNLNSWVPWHDSGGSVQGTPLFESLPVPATFPLLDRAVSFATWTPIISSATLSDWSLEALNKFQSQVPTTVSLPNFLYELREMKSMIPSIEKTSLSKTAANNFLAFEFGVKPFISDIKAILELSSKVEKRLQHLLSVNRKATRLSYNKDQDLSNEPLTYYLSGVSIGPNTQQSIFDLEFKRVSARLQLHIGAELYQDLQGLSDSMSTMKALASSGGFSSPARVVWNAIPYSFVVDWFFHVGKLLDTLTIQPFGGEYSVYNVGYSIKSECVYYVSQVHRGVNSSDPLGTVSMKSYIRRPGYPMTSLFLTNASLDPKQQVLALAMLEQKRR